MNWFSLILVVLVLAMLMRAASARSRLGLTLPVMLLVALLLGVATMAVSVPVRTTRMVARLPGDKAGVEQNTDASPVSRAAEDADGMDLDDTVIPVDGGAGEATRSERPAWVDREPVESGDAYQVSVASGPHETLDECRPALDERLRSEVAAYIDRYLGSTANGDYRVSDVIVYDLAYIQRNLVKSESVFVERLPISLMYQTHALLEFGPEFRRELDGRRGDLEHYAREWTIARRLRGLAFGFAAACSLLAFGFAWFRRGPAGASSHAS